MKRIPSDAECFAAARQLHDCDLQKIWRSTPIPKQAYDGLDPIGREEFDAIVERILIAAEQGNGVEAGARELWRGGGFHGWWGSPPLEYDFQGYDKMQPAERAEFDGVVGRLLKAAAQARGDAPR